jgi:hypothetical protein
MYIYILYDVIKNEELCFYKSYNNQLRKFLYQYKSKYRKKNIELKELFGEEILIYGEFIYNDRYILNKNGNTIRQKII